MSAEKLLFRRDGLHGHAADLHFVWQCGGSATLLATTGSDGSVAILGRQGHELHRIALPNGALCAGLDWDAEGDLLAIICTGSAQLLLWDANTQQQQIVDVGLRDALTCLRWSRSSSSAAGSLLALGTARGNLSIYNPSTTRRIPVLGKHSRRISGAAWSTAASASGALLALISDDRTMTLSTATGDSLRSVHLRDTPSDVQFATMKSDQSQEPSMNGTSAAGGAASYSGAGSENTVSVLLGHRHLFLMHLANPDTPSELGFQPKYGAIVAYRWFGDGYVMVGFVTGMTIAISTHAREMGQELWQVQNHREALHAIAVSPPACGWLASGGSDGTVKVHSQSQLRDSLSVLQLPAGGGVVPAVRAVEWSADGQLLAVSTQLGALFVYVTQLASLSATAANRVAVLSSLAEVTLYCAGQLPVARLPQVVPLEIEPAFIALGPRHLACGMNNHVWFYQLGGGGGSREPGRAEGRQTGAEVPRLLGDREYLAEIAAVRLSSRWCAVLCGGKITLHPIESDVGGGQGGGGGAKAEGGAANRQTQVFPGSVQGMQDAVITCMELSEEFLVFATDLGNVVFFTLNTWAPVIRWRHSMGIRHMFADADATKVVLIDEHNQGHVFLPATEDLCLIADFPKSCRRVLWDGLAANQFVAVAERECHTFVFVRNSVDGRHVSRCEPATTLLSGQTPVLLIDGELTLTTSGGGGSNRLATLTLETHRTPAATITMSAINSTDLPGDSMGTGTTGTLDHLMQLLQMRRYPDAWSLCRQLDTADAWQRLGQAALADLDVALALRAYRASGSCGTTDSLASSTDSNCAAAMVLALQAIQHVEDGAYVAATCALLLDRPDRAKALFARSVRPLEALELCRDLLQWEQAMSLAETLAPQQVASIAREYAEQLEFGGRYAEALQQYERGLVRDGEADAADGWEEHERQCRMGVARTSCKHGDAQRGVQLALQLHGERADNELLIDCADALLGGQPDGTTPATGASTSSTSTDAGRLLELAGAWDRACGLYVAQRAWPQVARLLPRCTSTALHAAYARATESAGDYAAAVRAYTAAGDLDAVVRVQLDRLKDPHAAGEIVLSTRSVEGARLLATFYQQIGDTEQALQFLLLCGCRTDALALARRHNRISRYAELLHASATDGSPVAPADYRAVAEHFEAERHTLQAGKYYALAGESARALRLLLRAATLGSAEEADAVQLAIDCVAAAHDDRLAEQLIAFLLGDGGGDEVGGGGAGVPREPKYLFRLYMARAQYREAAKTAVIIGEQEQQAGNYRAAHSLLFAMMQELRRNGLAVGAEMRANLVLLHRYALVRLQVRLGEHGRAARLLCVVADSVGQFPAHIVPILTSAVVECQRSGLTAAAFRHAATLMRPEYRTQIDPKYAKKIEAIVRRPPRGQRTEDAAGEEDPVLPCPVCDAPLASMQTVCQQCRSPLPICIATGQHLSGADLAACPECDMPCEMRAMSQILAMNAECPMCGESVDAGRLTVVSDAQAYVNAMA